MRNDYRYVLELLRPDGAALGQAPLTPDWEPAVECARVTGLRSFGVWASEAGVEHHVEPLWRTDLGEPYVDAFRIHLAANGHEWSEDFPATRYFSEAATAAAARLVESGVSRKGDRLLYRPTAFASVTQEPDAAGFRFDATDAPPPLALARTTLAVALAGSVPYAQIDRRDIEVLIPQSVLDEAAELTRQADARETGGVLIGHLHQDPTTQDVFVEVTAQIPARHTQSDSVKLTFTSETWTDVRQTIALRRRDEIMIAWWHSHPAREWCKACPPEQQRVCHLATGFLSADDKALHRAMFPRAFSVALVMTHTLTGVTATLFGWRAGVLEPRGFRLIGADSEGLRDTAARYASGRVVAEDTGQLITGESHATPATA